MRSAAFPYYNARGDLATRTDARGITTTYTYDALHRLTQKVYSDGTPAVSYFYDQTSYNGLTIANGKGRRTGMSDGSGATAWSYDVRGRVVKEQKTIAGITKTLSYAYNLDGSLASLTYPSGRVVSYDVTGAERPSYAKDTGNGINYALNASYAPQGALTSVLNGQSGTFGGVTASVTYNNRLLPATLVASSTAGTALNLAFSYLGNGNVSTVTNNRDSNRTESFTYDALNRVATAQTATTTGACWGQSYGYDRYANLTSATVTKCAAPALSLSVNGNNQVTNPGFSFDAAGNTTSDGSYNYTWDAEGRLKTAAGVTYTYDGDGERVKKSNGTLYWFGAGISPLAETDLSGNTTNEYIFFGGSRIARRDSAGNVSYYFGDNLGSSRSITTSTGGLCYDADFYPFGGERVITSTCGENYKFTGMERDSETGNDHTLFRQYASNLGRWLSPDPLGGDVTNPQSLNRYAYVLNNPTNLIDPQGLDGELSCLDSGEPEDCESSNSGGQGFIFPDPEVCGPQFGSCDDGSGDEGGFGDGGGEGGGRPSPACGVDPFCHTTIVQAGLAAFDARLQAQFDYDYLVSLAEQNGNYISQADLQAFASLHPDVAINFGLLESASDMTIYGSELLVISDHNLYGYRVVVNPLVLAGIEAQGPAEAAFLGTGLALVGPPVIAFAPEALGAAESGATAAGALTDTYVPRGSQAVVEFLDGLTKPHEFPTTVPQAVGAVIRIVIEVLTKN